MKHYLAAVFALIVFALLTSALALAQTHEKMVVALRSDDFNLDETDISTLAIGEAKTIETGSGKIIDILRTSEGAEIYVDGELFEMNFSHDDLHEVHSMDRHVEIICDNEKECNENIVIFGHDDHTVSGWATEDGERIVIHKEFVVTCRDDEQGGHCDNEVIVIPGAEDIDLEQLSQRHQDGKEHKLIVIKKTLVTED